MFEYLEPEASGAFNPPPSAPSTSQARPEKVRHLLYGSLAGIDRTIKLLHAHGYADPNNWSDPIPAPPSSIEPGHPGQPQTWIAILTKTVLIE